MRTVAWRSAAIYATIAGIETAGLEMITIVWLVAAIAVFGFSFAAAPQNQSALRWTAGGIVLAGIALEVLIGMSIASRMG
jgi:hypothetical protein